MSNDEYKNCHSCGAKLKSGLFKCIFCESLFKKDPDRDLSQIIYCTISWQGGNYEGEVLFDKPHGYGVFNLPNGTRYSGEWSDGKPNGKGKIVYSNGGVYEGDFQNGKRHGLGTYSFSDGRKLEGEWKNGEFVRSIAKTDIFEDDTYSQHNKIKSSVLGKSTEVTNEHYNRKKQDQNNNTIWGKWWLWLVLASLAIIITLITSFAGLLILTGIVIFIIGIVSIIKPLKALNIYNRGIGLLVLFIGFIILFFGTSISDIDSNSISDIDLNEIREQAIELSYDELARYPEINKGVPVIQTGKIIQKISDTTFRVNITKGEYGFWRDTIYVRLLGEAKNARLLEDDIISLTGLAQGEITYESILGQSITIPRIDAYEVSVIQKGID